MKTTDKKVEVLKRTPQNHTQAPTMTATTLRGSLRPQKSMVRIKSLKPKRLAVITEAKRRG